MRLQFFFQLTLFLMELGPHLFAQTAQPMRRTRETADENQSIRRPIVDPVPARAAIGNWNGRPPVTDDAISDAIAEKRVRYRIVPKPIFASGAPKEIFGLFVRVENPWDRHEDDVVVFFKIDHKKGTESAEPLVISPNSVGVQKLVQSMEGKRVMMSATTYRHPQTRQIFYRVHSVAISDTDFNQDPEEVVAERERLRDAARFYFDQSLTGQ